MIMHSCFGIRTRMCVLKLGCTSLWVVIHKQTVVFLVSERWSSIQNTINLTPFQEWKSIGLFAFLYIGDVEALVNEETLLRTHCCPWCFLGCANWEIFVADTKCFWQEHLLCPGARFSKLPVITGPVKLFCFPFQMGVSKLLKSIQ